MARARYPSWWILVPVAVVVCVVAAGTSARLALWPQRRRPAPHGAQSPEHAADQAWQEAVPPWNAPSGRDAGDGAQHRALRSGPPDTAAAAAAAGTFAPTPRNSTDQLTTEPVVAAGRADLSGVPYTPLPGDSRPRQAARPPPVPPAARSRAGIRTNGRGMPRFRAQPARGGCGEGRGAACPLVRKGRHTVRQCAETVLILYWTPFFFTEEHHEEGYYPDCGGNVTVVATRDRSVLDGADAVVLHARDVEWDRLPRRAHPSQPRVLLTYENQQLIDRFEQDAKYMRQFNMLASYHPSSDVVLSYMMEYRYPEVMRAAPVPVAERRRDAPLVWIASNCDEFVVNNRQAYMAELMRHVAVHSYGKCLHNRDFDTEDRGEQDKVVRHYRFYFAAENTVCDDYVTEKFFRALAFGVVPVVYGAPNIAQVAPTPDSYIDVRDYKSPRDLAAHLRRLASDDGAYSRLVRWKTAPLSELNPAFVSRMDRRPWVCHLAHALRRQRTRPLRRLSPLPPCPLDQQDPGWSKERREADREADRNGPQSPSAPVHSHEGDGVPAARDDEGAWHVRAARPVRDVWERP